MYFRVDLNQTIATGHVMRCIAIADAFRVQGETSTFISADENSKKTVEKRGYKSIVLDSNWQDMESELDRIISLIQEKKIQEIFIDSYFVTKRYLEELQKHVKVIYLDDLDKMVYPVNMLICYSRYMKQDEYKNKYLNSLTKVLLGSEYIPLRKEFWEIEKRTNRVNQRKKVLITSGGTDYYNATYQIVKEVAKNSKNDYIIVSGAHNINYESLLALEKENQHVSVLKNVDNMAALMQGVDCAISATGTTVFELCACQVPSICYVIADNQLELATYMRESGTMIYAGDFRTSDKNVIEIIRAKIEIMLFDQKNREKMIAAMQQMTKKIGAIEIASEIRKEFPIRKESGDKI